MKPPPLFHTHPHGHGVLLSVVLPILFGAVTGWSLGVSELAYLVLSVLGIGGGFFAGYEHDWHIEGIYRGLLGGLLFGSSILITHGLIDKEPKAELPDPETLLIVITAVFGTLLGWLGARAREKREAAGKAMT